MNVMNAKRGLSATSERSTMPVVVRIPDPGRDMLNVVENMKSSV